MRRFFNESLVDDKNAQVTVKNAKGQHVALPVVKGVIGVPDDLMPRISLTAAWRPFTGQVQDVSDDALKPEVRRAG